MHEKHNTLEYVGGVGVFIKFAEKYASESGEEFIMYPCFDCKNQGKFYSSKQVKSYLRHSLILRKGIIGRYRIVKLYLLV